MHRYTHHIYTHGHIHTDIYRCIYTNTYIYIHMHKKHIYNVHTEIYMYIHIDIYT